MRLSKNETLIVVWIFIISLGCAIYFFLRWLLNSNAFFRSKKQDLKRFSRDIEKHAPLVSAMNLDGNYSAEFAKYLSMHGALEIKLKEERYPHNPDLMEYNCKDLNWKHYEQNFLSDFGLHEHAQKNLRAVKIINIMNFMAKVFALFAIQQFAKW